MTFTDCPAEQGTDCSIDSTARFGANCRLGDSVTIEPYAIIHDQVTIGDGSRIASHAVIGRQPSGFQPEMREAVSGSCMIGPNSEIGPGALVETDVVIDNRLQLGAHAAIRQGARIGANLRAGSFVDIRGDGKVGDCVTLFNHVHISRHSLIGSYCWLLPFAALLNDRYPPTNLESEGPKLGEYCVIGARALLFPGITLGRHVVVAAASRVKNSIDDYQIVSGWEAKAIGDSRVIPCKLGGKYIRPYPWMQHVSAGFPWENSAPPS